MNKYILSFDLRKSEVEKGEKRAKSWCHNYLFLASLLLVSNDIHQHRNFKENSVSRVVKIELTHHAASPNHASRDSFGPGHASR